MVAQVPLTDLVGVQFLSGLPINKRNTMTVIKASHILVADEQQAINLLNQINGGADFTELAKVHSTCPSGKEGGYLGPFGRNQMVRPFEEAAFALDIEKISQPIKTNFGWHIIKRTG